MATISVENAVVKGHHVYLSEVRTGDIFDCFPGWNKFVFGNGNFVFRTIAIPRS